MPSTDTSMRAALMRAGISAANADELDDMLPTAAQTAAVASLVSGARSQPVVTGLDTQVSRVQCAHWPCSDNSGTTLAETLGRGPSIAVTGTTTGAWATPGWFTHDAAGNTLKLTNLPYVDGLINMATEGAILIGCDYYVTVWPTTATENLWSLHQSAESTTGGLRLAMTTAAPGRFSVYYKPNGGSETSHVTFPATTYLSVRNSILVEAWVVPSANEIRTVLFHNGRAESSSVSPLGTPPASSAVAGLCFSGYGQSANGKLGAGGSTGTRVQNLFVARHDGTDRNIAGRLARDIYANSALPSWLTRL